MANTPVRGIPMACGPVTGVASTARPWRPCAWKSTIDTKHQLRKNRSFAVNSASRHSILSASLEDDTTSAIVLVVASQLFCPWRPTRTIAGFLLCQKLAHLKKSSHRKPGCRSTFSYGLSFQVRHRPSQKRMNCEKSRRQNHPR